MIVVGNRPTQDHFSKVSIYNFSGLKKYKTRVYRNDKKNLPWDFWEVSWVGLFPTTISIAIFIVLDRTAALLKKRVIRRGFPAKFTRFSVTNIYRTCTWPPAIFITFWCVSITSPLLTSVTFIVFRELIAKKCSKNFYRTLREISVAQYQLKSYLPLTFSW